jgi:hypothetical protein
VGLRTAMGISELDQTAWTEMGTAIHTPDPGAVDSLCQIFSGSGYPILPPLSPASRVTDALSPLAADEAKKSF